MLNYYSWWVGGWWVGGSEKNEINAILNSKLKLELVEVGVELGKTDANKYFLVMSAKIRILSLNVGMKSDLAGLKT